MSQSSLSKLNNQYIKIHQTIKNINSQLTTSYKKPISNNNSNYNIKQKKESDSIRKNEHEKLLTHNSKSSITKKSSLDIDINKPFSSEQKEYDYKLEKEKHLKHNKNYIHGNDSKKNDLNDNSKLEKIKNKNHSNEKLLSKDDKMKNDFDKIRDKINNIEYNMVKHRNDFLKSVKDKQSIEEKLFKSLKEIEKNIIKENKENNKIIVKENNKEMLKQYGNKFDNLQNDISQIKNLLNLLLSKKREREESINYKKQERKQKNIYENETLNDSNYSNSNSFNDIEIKKEIDYAKMIENIENKYPNLMSDNDFSDFFPNDDIYSNLNDSQIDTQIHNQSDFVNKIELHSDNQNDNKIYLHSDNQSNFDNSSIKNNKEKDNINKNKIVKESKFEIEFQKYYIKDEFNNSIFYGIPFDSNINFIDNNTIEYPNSNINKQFFLLTKDILNFNEDFKYVFILHKMGIGISIGLVNINLTVKNNFKMKIVQSKCSILISTSSRIYNYLDNRNNNNKVISKNKKDFEKIILDYNSRQKYLQFNSPGHFTHSIDLNFNIIKNDEFRIGVFFRGKNTLITVNKI